MLYKACTAVLYKACTAVLYKGLYSSAVHGPGPALYTRARARVSRARARARARASGPLTNMPCTALAQYTRAYACIQACTAVPCTGVRARDTWFRERDTCALYARARVRARRTRSRTTGARCMLYTRARMPVYRASERLYSSTTAVLQQ